MEQTRPLRLMIIDTSPVNSGGAQILFRYARYFDPARVRPTMVLHEENLWSARYREAGTADVIVETGLFQSNTIPPIHEIPLTSWLPKAGGAVAHLSRPVLRLARTVREREIDVVMGVCDTAAALAAIVGTMTGRPAIMHLVSTYVNRFNPAALNLVGRLPAVRRLVMLSNYTASYFKGLGDKVQTIYSGIDLADFDRPIVPSLRSRHGLGADVPLVGIAGRFVEIKGMDVFARAAARVAREVPEARFFMLGDDRGEFGDSVHRMVGELGLGDRVIFTGFVDDMHAALADLDVVVVPSRRECAPVVIFESMALGKPVVASRIHGIPELVEEEATGLMRPVGDDAAFADAIVRLLREPETRARMGERARRRVHEEFSIEHATRQFEETIIQVAGETGWWRGASRLQAVA